MLLCFDIFEGKVAYAMNIIYASAPCFFAPEFSAILTLRWTLTLWRKQCLFDTVLGNFRQMRELDIDSWTSDWTLFYDINSAWICLWYRQPRVFKLVYFSIIPKDNGDKVNWCTHSVDQLEILGLTWRVYRTIKRPCEGIFDSTDLKKMRTKWWKYNIYYCCRDQGAVSIRKTVLPGMAIPMLKIRRPNGRLIFNMEITICR